MSIVAVAWAWQQTTGNGTRKLVLVALADRHNKDTGRCDPSIPRIADDTELSETTVKKALRELVAAGLIERVRRKRNDGSDLPNLYRFPHLDAREGVGGVSRRGEGASASQGEGASPDPEPEVNLEPEVEPEVLPAAPVYDPIKGRRVNGQDLPWNALAEATKAYGEANGPRMKRALATIRPVIWEHAQSRGLTLDSVQEDPDRYEQAAAQTVVVVARALLRNSDVTWGPEGIARNFARALDSIDSGRSIVAIVEEVRDGSAG